MQAHENHLRKLLADNQQYLIPLFQRFYVWEKPAWGRLLDDLMELLEDNEPGRTHFLGSMVVIPTPAALGADPRAKRTKQKKKHGMSQVIIDNPIINSPFEEPQRHFRFTDDGITDEIGPGRRRRANRSGYGQHTISAGR